MYIFVENTTNATITYSINKVKFHHIMCVLKLYTQLFYFKKEEYNIYIYSHFLIYYIMV